MSQDTLINIIKDVQQLIREGIQTLPVSIGATMIVIGLFTANYAMLFFLIGFLMITPGIAWLLNTFVAPLSEISEKFKIKQNDLCNINFKLLSDITQTDSDKKIIISEWLAMSLFFFGYMIMNAVKLISKDPNEDPVSSESGSPDNNFAGMVSTRKTQAIVSIVSVLIVFCGIVYYRLSAGCESFKTDLLSILVGVIACGSFFGLGFLWYYALSSVAEDRLSDLFGIANRLVSSSALVNGPIVCTPPPEPCVP